jgi:hypothetical protein
MQVGNRKRLLADPRLDSKGIDLFFRLVKQGQNLVVYQIFPRGKEVSHSVKARGRSKPAAPPSVGKPLHIDVTDGLAGIIGQVNGIPRFYRKVLYGDILSSDGSVSE